jgi:hypothetical protein
MCFSIIDRLSCGRSETMTNADLRHQSSSKSKPISLHKHPTSRNLHRKSRTQSQKTTRRFWRDNGLSVVLVIFFLLFFGGQTFSGWFHYNEELQEHQQASIGLLEYLHSGAFGEAVFENWESEFLQMGLYVLLTTFLFQRGSAESKDPDESADEESHPFDREHAPLLARRGGFVSALYSHSLSIAFGALFAISFAGHALWGASAYNAEAAQHGQSAISVWQYLTTSQFWFESFQNWQSEFLAILAIVVLSIWLREKGSPESKPVLAPHSKTGG